MHLQTIDWAVVVTFLAFTLAVGVALTRRASSSAGEFFLSGRNMPWWLLGVSMVATTFSTDTPNLVTDIVRTRGVAGNWIWWAFLAGDRRRRHHRRLIGGGAVGPGHRR